MTWRDDLEPPCPRCGGKSCRCASGGAAGGDLPKGDALVCRTCWKPVSEVTVAFHECPECAAKRKKEGS